MAKLDWTHAPRRSQPASAAPTRSQLRQLARLGAVAVPRTRAEADRTIAQLERRERLAAKGREVAM